MEIELNAHEWARAAYFGTARSTYQKQVRGIKDADKYEGMKFKIVGVNQDILGVACEYAVVKFLGLDPNNCQWCKFSTNPADYKAPDILGIIDVRRVTNARNPLRAEMKDVRDGAILVKAYVPNAREEGGELKTDGTVRLLGWETAQNVKDKGRRGYRGTWEKTYIQPMHSLATAVGVAA